MSGRSREDSPAWQFRLWITCVVLAAAVLLVLLTATVMRHAMLGGPRLSPAQARAIVALGEFPSQVRAAFKDLLAQAGDDPVQFLLERDAVETPAWVRRFPAPDDPGYLLQAGIDAKTRQSNVELIRIADGRSMARWQPDWGAVYGHITDKPHAPRGSPRFARAIHPLLLPDGDVVFNTDNSLTRLAPCSGVPVWVIDDVMHHSIQPDGEGGLWVPSVSEDGLRENAWLRSRVRDDAIAHVSADGRVLEKRSFIRILRDNGLEALVLGTHGALEEDPIHLNEIQVAPADSRHWRKGDLLLSARHISTVLLYRPSTNEVIWHRTGPWMNQHSADFVDDHRISVFDNHVINGLAEGFLAPDEVNRVLVFDFDTGAIEQPFAAALAEAKPKTITEGRARLLPDGGLFLEESNYGRLLRFANGQLLWSRVNDYDAHRVGVLSWSRYLTADEAAEPLRALESRPCGPPAK